VLTLEENSFGVGAKTKTAPVVRPGKYNLVQSTGFDYQAGGASTLKGKIANEKRYQDYSGPGRK
jgi:hypothetical protein